MLNGFGRSGFRSCRGVLRGFLLITCLSGFTLGGAPVPWQLDVEGGDYPRALPMLREAAHDGDTLAESYLGLMYRDALGVDRNPRTAAFWFLRAALAGNVAAEFNVGLAFDEGEGVKQDPAQARRWYRLAAEQGSGRAAYRLASLYYDGLGGRKSIGASIEWLTRAVDLGFVSGARDLGILYFERDHGSRDRITGYMWLLVARASGDREVSGDLRAFRHRLDNAQHQEAHRLARHEYAYLAEQRSDAQLDASHSPSLLASRPQARK